MKTNVSFTRRASHESLCRVKAQQRNALPWPPIGVRQLHLVAYEDTSDHSIPGTES